MAQVRVSVDEADGRLPAVCMRCGEPATTTVTRKMQWHPSWVYIMILPGLLIYVIVALIMTKHIAVQAPLCDKHKGHWFKRAMLMLGTFFLFALAGVGALVLAGNLDKPLSDQLMPFACVFSCVMAVAWVVLVIVCKATEIGPKEITDTEVLLGGVSDNFVDAVAEADREREERRAARRRERSRHRDDDDDDAPPRKKRPSDDRIEE